MKPKTLIPLLLICAVLGAVIMMKRSTEETTTLVEQAELTSLAPDGLDVDSVNRIEVYAGANNGHRVILQRDGDGWKIGSHFDAVAIKGRAQQLLDAVNDIQGEFRATATDEQLADYDLSVERGFHVIGFDGDERNERFHVIVGKSPKYGDMFMRASGSNDVYIVNHNLRRDAFNYSLDWDDPPMSDPWTDKTVVSLKGDDYTKIELTMPDKTLVAELREKPAEEETDPADGETTSAVPADPGTEWVVTEGGRDRAIHQTPFSDLTRYISNLGAFAILSPLKKNIWGLDEPGYFITAHRENGEKVALTVSHQSFTGPAHLIRTDNDNPTIFSITNVNFAALFASGGSFYDLPGLLLEEDSLRSVNYATEQGSVKLAKTDGVWTIISPEADLAPNTSALSKLERTLSSWQAVDYADDDGNADWANSGDVVTFGNEDVSHTIALGIASTHAAGRYAKLDDQNDRLVMSQTNVDQIFLPLGQLFETDLFTLGDEDEITQIEITKASDEMTLTLADGVWSATVADESFDTRAKSISDFIATIEGLESVDVQLADARSNGAMVGSVTLNTAQGVEWVLRIEEQVDGNYPAIVNDTQAANMIDQKTFNKLFPSFEAFKAVEGEETGADNETAFQGQKLVGFGDVQDSHEGHNH